MGDFEIRVVENIGEKSLNLFGEPGTELEVVGGWFRDSKGAYWDNEHDGFEDIDDIDYYFSQPDGYQTVFELVED